MSPGTDDQAQGALGRELGGSILLAGAGKMGGALLEGWLGLGLSPERLIVIEPQPTDAIVSLTDRGLCLNPTQGLDREIAAAVIAVKPQIAPEVVPALRPFIRGGTIVVSIMAGRTLRFLQASLPDTALVRAMPNTPAAIGRGITVAVPNSKVSATQRKLVHALLSAVGRVEWIENEAFMDAVTAVSGSGPAYVFLLCEAMARAGCAAGLPRALADALARATVAGSGELLQQSELDPAILRENVTSPGGTTAAALDILMGNDGLPALMQKAIAAATKRSRELAG
jgi:pyrroline-5-carboxylate reductase